MTEEKKKEKIKAEIALVGRYKGKVLFKKLDTMYNREGLFYETFLIYKDLKANVKS